jgi:hypothetical protein
MTTRGQATLVAAKPSTRQGDIQQRCQQRCVADFRRAFRAIYIAGLAIGPTVIGVGAISSWPGVSPVVVHWLSGVAGGLGSVAGIMLLGRVRLIPAEEMLLWMSDRTADLFAEMDGQREIPTNSEAVLARVGQRCDAAAIFQRVAALDALGRSAEAQAEIDSWTPADPIWACRRERLASHVHADSAEAHLSQAEVALQRIVDPVEQAAQRAMLTVEVARSQRHDMWPGLRALSIARRQIRSFSLAPRPELERPTRRLFLGALAIGSLIGACGLFVTETTLLTLALFMAALVAELAVGRRLQASRA